MQLKGQCHEILDPYFLLKTQSETVSHSQRLRGHQVQIEFFLRKSVENLVILFFFFLGSAYFSGSPTIQPAHRVCVCARWLMCIFVFNLGERTDRQVDRYQEVDRETGSSGPDRLPGGPGIMVTLLNHKSHDTSPSYLILYSRSQGV